MLFLKWTEKTSPSISSLEVLVTLTTDVGKILASLHRVQSKGDIKFLTAVKIAHVSITVAILKFIFFNHWCLFYHWCLCMVKLVYYKMNKISSKRATSITSDKVIQSNYRLSSLLSELSFLSVGVKTQTREKSQNEDCCVCGKSCWGWWKGGMLLNFTFYSTNIQLSSRFCEVSKY